jgi:hypothetical protein
MAVLAVGIACIRIVMTYPIFSQTFDEPQHIGDGMEWLDRGTYTLGPFTPPLARVAAAIGPFLAGCRLRVDDPWEGGNQILYAGGKYRRNLSLARLGELPFFVLAVCTVWAWTRRLFGEGVAVVSVLIFTMLPPVLGHAGLATTDMAAAATCVAAFYAFARWLDQGDVTRSLILALTVALALLSKFSSLVFLPSCALAMLAVRWWLGKRVGSHSPARQMPRVLAVGLTALAACLLIWAGYRFSTGTLAMDGAAMHWRAVDAFGGGSGLLHDLAHEAAVSMPLPAPEFFRGLGAAHALNHYGLSAYILGRIHRGYCWYFFLVVLAVKSPLAFLILAGIGFAILLKRPQCRADWRLLAPCIAAATILLVTMPVKIHLGVRHILIIYPLLAIVAGFGAVSLWQNSTHRRLARAATVALLAWLVVSSVRAHPDYFPYFNELAGSHPERILIDSDLDWGQDLLRLGQELRSRRVERVSLSYFGTADPSRHGLPPFTELVPFQPATGWIAISVCNLKGALPDVAGAYSWLEAYRPVARVGRSIWIYDIPPTPTEASGKLQAARYSSH